MNEGAPRTPLKPLVRLAIQQGNTELVSDYLDKGGDVEARDLRGRTPLILAAINGDAELCRLLLGYGADSNGLDDEGLSAIAHATGKGHMAAAAVLEDKQEALEEAGSESSLGFEFESEFFDDWSSEGETSAPEDDSEIREKLAESHEQAAKHQIVDHDGDWSDVGIDLPSSDALSIAQDLQRVEIREMVSSLIGEATDYGRFNPSRVESIAREFDGLPDGEFSHHLTQLLCDLGFVMDGDDDWLSGPVIEDSRSPTGLDEEAQQYLVDLAARTNDPYSSLSRNVELSVLLGRDGEERIGRMTSVAISDACHAISMDEKAIEALLGMCEEIRGDAYLVGRISRIGDESSAETESSEEVDVQAVASGGDERSRDFLARLEQVCLARASYQPNQKAHLHRAILDLELTTVGIRTIQRLCGSENAKLDDAVERLTRLEWEMFSANMRLAISVANKYSWSNLPQMDRIQEAFMGLMRAIEKFDFSRGYKFSTYATWWIRQAVTRAIADKGRLIRLPVHVFERIGKLQRSARENGFDSPRELPVDVLSCVSGMAPSDVVKAILVVEDATLMGDSREAEEFASNAADDAQSPEEFAAFEDFRRYMNSFVDGLPPRERLVIRQRFGFDDGVEKTLEEVGRTLNVTRERIRQIEAKALRLLRKQYVLDELKIYL